MAWRARRSHVETIDKVASLEKLCLLIGYQIRDMGEARGRVVIHPTSLGSNRAYHFAGAYFEEQCSDRDKEEVMSVGINNLRYFFNEQEYVLESQEGNVRIYQKPSKTQI